MLAIAAGVLLAASSATAAAGGPLHLPSPDWRDQVIYFVMTDRFDDGDPGNNDQHAGEYDPADPARYQGGDLRGLQRRLDYIQGLGVTAVWITPPVANRWWDPAARHGGYHGYWADDFSKVDAHLGTLADYQALSRDLHGRGMYLVQDIVLNHTADWFDYAGGWDPAKPAEHFRLTPDSRGQTGPTQWPFSQNDARDPVQRAAAIYHWTPPVADFRDPHQVLDFQMSGLDDLNSENPVVRRALRRSYGDWIRKAGVDAFRLDTAFYVPTAALHDFMHSQDPAAPGMDQVAAATGRRDFLVFGEGFAIDKPFEDSQARRIEALTRDPDGRPLLSGMLNFPLYGSLGDVFARGRPTAELGWRIADLSRVHAHPERMPTFVDNHDVDRFLAGGDVRGLQQALLAILTLPGIPTLYYGTEQGLTGQRAAMFAAGSGSGGRDRFDTNAPLYRFLQQAIALRRSHKVFSRGSVSVLRDTAAGPGAIAWQRQDGADTGLVAMNTSSGEVLLDNLETGLPEGTRLRPVFGLDARAEDVTVGRDGRVQLRLGPRDAAVWMAVPAAAPKADARPASDLRIDPIGELLTGDVDIRGVAPGAASLALVVDGQLSTAQVLPVDGDGRWRARLDSSDLVDPRIQHRLVAWDAARGQASPALAFRVQRAWTPLVQVEDPAGDDRGPGGHYLYPLDGSWRDPTLDLRRITVEGSGGGLRLTLGMGALSQRWNPPNGFDHVAFTVFIQLPDVPGGSRIMPLQNATLPGDMRWHVRLRAHGWSNALFADEGADARHEGRPIVPAASIDIDQASGSVRLTLSPAALGHRRDLSGARIYISTWDYDGGFRGLQPAPSANQFGGGDGARDPLVMDDSAVIVLP